MKNITVSKRHPDGSWDVFQPEISNFCSNTIICGSRRYKNINFDKLVDSFENIFRHNMLLPDNNYGQRNATYQIFNIHIWDNYIKKTSLDKWILDYHKSFGISKDHIVSFYEYLKSDTVKFKYCHDNNTSLMLDTLKKHNISHEINMSHPNNAQRRHPQVRCGIGSIAECIKKRIKPHLIGFGLQKNSVYNKQYASKDGTSKCHDAYSEIDLIKELHKAGLVDATFCAIKDSKEISIDSSPLSPTIISLNILKEVYHNVCVTK